MEEKGWWEQPDWILLGDQSQYEFLFRVLPQAQTVPDLKKHSVRVRSGRTFHMEQREAEIRLTAPALPPRTLLLLPPDQTPSVQPEPYGTRYAVFEETPFQKDTTLALCRELTRQKAEFQVVFIDRPLVHAASDLDTPEQALHAAQKSYAGQGIPYQTIRDGADILVALHRRQPLADYWRQNMAGRLEALWDRIEALDIDYEWQVEDWGEENGLLSEQLLDRLCSGETVRRSNRKTIWGCFAERGMQLLFPQKMSGGLCPVIELYQDCIRDCSLTFLPLEKDGDLLWREMKKAAEDAFRQAAVPGDKPFPFSEKEYLKLVAGQDCSGSGVDARFAEFFKHFVRTKPLELCKEMLTQRYDRLKRYL